MASGPVEQVPRVLRGPWEGETKIIIGVDIGTTYSGVTFSYLQTGATQIIQRVTKWPGQEARNEQGKIPTVVLYDGDKAVAFGAEALLPDMEEETEKKKWFLVKHFKLHLHPDDMKTGHNLKLDKLPPAVPLHQIYSDFLGYLLRHTKSYFEDRIIGGKETWGRYHSSMELVIAHPNGWGIREQTFLREVVINTGFVKSQTASKQVRFVTEAEASVHYCIHYTNLGARLQAGANFVVCDAGGSTVDTTLYSVISSHPSLKLKEERASACVQAGAIFVDAEAENYLSTNLEKAGVSPEDVKEYTKAATKDFEGFAKRYFNEKSPYTVEVGDRRFSVSNEFINARRGRVTLPDPMMKGFFDVCCDEILLSVDQQVEGHNVQYIILVGGFGDSPYLRNEFKKRYEPKGSHITLTNDSSAKPVADGAVIWNMISSVFARAPRYSFGVICATPFLPWIGDNDGREIYIGANGLPLIPGAWSQIVAKGVSLDSGAVRRKTFTCERRTATPDSNSMSMELYAYSGDDEPDWAWDREEELRPEFRKVCTIKGDLQSLHAAMERRVGLRGSVYWTLKVQVCIRFGGTELEAHMEWEENGAPRHGPVEIIPEGSIRF